MGNRTLILFGMLGILINLIGFGVEEAEALTIPDDRKINWQPGVPGGIITYPAGINVTTYGANGNDTADDTSAINNALAAASPNTAVLIPAGTYYISNTITLGKNNIALRGEGYQKTKLIFTLNSGYYRLFQFNANSSCDGATDGVSVTGGLTKGSTTLTVSNASSFTANGYAQIREDNDPLLYKTGELTDTSGWTARAIGQVLKIKQISGNTLTLDRPLNLTYKSALNPLICAAKMTEKSGIENLYVQVQATSGSVNNFDFHHSAYCWVKNVYSKMTRTAHVWLDTSLGAEIRGSVFDGSYSHTGGNGYGISAERRATDSLIEDNIFNHLRHSMVLSIGANGTVFGYNFSRNTFDEESANWLSDDAVAHGVYPYQNLFEGNTFQRATTDNNWGTNGNTTYFRNRIEKDVANFDQTFPYGTNNFSYVLIENNNPGHNIIGNELGIPGSFATTPISYEDASLAPTIIESCNYSYQDNKLWGGTDCNIPASLYLASKPAFLGNSAWPPFRGDISPNNNIIPAKQRWNDKTYIPGGAANTTPSPTTAPTITPTASPNGKLFGISETIQAEEGLISPPFIVDSGKIYQTSETGANDGGKATYRVNIPVSGKYQISAMIGASTDSNNSIYINFDSEPVDPTMIWDVLPLTTSGAAERRLASWRGAGDYQNPQYNPKVFGLAAGEHTLIIKGREANAWLDALMIEPAGMAGDANGDGKADDLDFLVWAKYYGLTNATGAAQGDFNGDKSVDDLDYIIWVNNNGK